VVIVNIATSYVIKLYGQYLLLLAVLLVIGVIEHRGWCSPKGWGSVTALVKNSCKIYTTMVMGHLFQAKWWEKHPSGCSFLFIMAKEISKSNGKGFRKERWNFRHIYF